ncbi:MAG: glutamyl-tRNA reductase [Candidatus Omnitrophica bacterium]|nr:glutamyl-tRNA reductase [Candidatus Omnitrophota bacterium]MCM8802602.1 glutamyl-tRNA reductase [Candidatus Omnitrophota bacterium]
MNFGLVGISHKTAPLEIRERYSFTKKKVSDILSKYILNETIDEIVILSTCNRTEVYITTDMVNRALKSLCDELQIKKEDLHYFYFLQDKYVVKHLFSVASGLDSQIIGENQILGQVKNAYFIAKGIGTTKKHLNKLFHKAIEVGKIIRTKTKISEGNISIVSVALKLIERLCEDIERKKILIIGTGKISELMVEYLKKKGIYGVFVANRTYEKAVKLAEKINGKAVRFDNLINEIKDTDIIISATASPHLILKKDTIQDLIKYRGKPLYIIDLALPRDVDPDIKNINNVILCNLDDINLVIMENYTKKLKEAEKAKKIIEEEVEKFWKCINYQPSELVAVQVSWL